MTSVWRVCDARFQKGALSGEGALKYPGRWNLFGVPMIYAATSPALASLETFVNFDREDAPATIVLLELNLHARMATIADEELPGDWRSIFAA